MFGKRLVGVVLAAAAGLCLLPAVAAANAVAQGQWLCRDRGVDLPLRGALVELHSTGLFGIDSGIADMNYTDSQGRFTVAAPSGGEYFLRLVLRDRQDVHLAPWPDPFGDWHADTAHYHLVQGTNAVGANVLYRLAGATTDCAVWQGFHDSYMDYATAMGGDPSARLGSVPPFGDNLLIRGDFFPNGGVPFTLYDTPDWVSGYETGPTPGDYTVTRHEFGHSFRQQFDGSPGHFFLDVANYSYVQNHSHCDAKNAGFAFNEGWAEFWSGDTGACHTDNQTGLANATHPDVEGDVAASLAALQAYCNDSRAQMVAVLQANPAAIHSYNDFVHHINVCHPTPNPSPPPAPSHPGPVESNPNIARVARYLRQEHASMHHELAQLSSRLNSVVGDLHRHQQCFGANCDRHLYETVLPPILRGRIRMLTIESGLLKSYTSASALRHFSKLPERRQIGIDMHLIKTVKADGRRVALGTLRGALSAIHGLLARDHSKRAKLLRRLLSQNLAQAGHGILNDEFLGNGIPPGTVVHKTSIRHFPPPKPFGGIFRPARSLTLTCPGKDTVKNPVTVSGQLSPAAVGATLKVVYRLNSTDTITHSVPTDSTGSFKDSATPDQPGNWTVEATYAGDPMYGPSFSPVCSVTVEP